MEESIVVAVRPIHAQGGQYCDTGDLCNVKDLLGPVYVPPGPGRGGGGGGGGGGAAAAAAAEVMTLAVAALAATVM